MIEPCLHHALLLLARMECCEWWCFVQLALLLLLGADT
jgi:hypothetical protein